MSLLSNITISGILKQEVSTAQEALQYVGINSSHTPCHVMISKTPIAEYLGSFEAPEEDDDSCFIYVKRRNYDSENGSWLSTLVHELTHLKQFLEGRLTHDMLCAQTTVDAADNDYLSLRYEVEARRAEFAFRRDIQKEEALQDNYFIRSYANIGQPLL